MVPKKYQNIFKTAENVTQIKQMFVRYATEEHMRRHQNYTSSFCINNKEKTISLLYPSHKTFTQSTFNTKKDFMAQEESASKSKNQIVYSFLDTKVSSLKSKFAFEKFNGKSKHDLKKGQKQILNEEQKVEKNNKYDGLMKNIDFVEAIKEALLEQPWHNQGSIEFVKSQVKHFDQSMIMLFNQICQPALPFKDIMDLPSFYNTKDNILKLLAIFLQNGSHDKNSKRVEAIEQNTYKDIK